MGSGKWDRHYCGDEWESKNRGELEEHLPRDVAAVKGNRCECHAILVQPVPGSKCAGQQKFFPALGRGSGGQLRLEDDPNLATATTHLSLTYDASLRGG